MTTSEWAAGYLEALIESSALVNPAVEAASAAASTGAGQRKLDGDGTSFNAADLKGQSSIALRYFLTEVTGFSEQQLHRTWMRATVMKDVGDRGARLENFCWRIWHLSRKKRQLKLEAASREEQRREEQREVEKDLRQEMGGEEWDENADVEEAPRVGPTEREKDSPELRPPKGQKTVGFMETEGRVDGDGEDEAQTRRLYIVMISMHGLVRGENMELGRDSDTGGQVKYVVEFARALATMPSVYRVDLITRQITDPEVDFSYGEPLEMLNVTEGEIAVGESAGVYIVRVPCGPPNKYLRKEMLWPFIPELVDRSLAHVHHMARMLMDELGEETPVWPHVVHGHYADAGDAAALLSGALNVPMVLTGHSLGRNKLEQLLKQGHMSVEEIVAHYNILRRIEGEEFSLDAAELVVTSTRQEVDEQWGLYDGFDVRLELVLRKRQRKGLTCHGRYMPRMAVIPPGMDFSNVVVPSIGDEEGEGAPGEGRPPSAVSAPADAPEPPIWNEIGRFFTNPSKPMILALARPDPKKNLTALVKAYGSSAQLRELANLTLIMGNRDDIDEMPVCNADVLLTVLKLIDRYDLYGLVAYPKHHKQSDVSHIYVLAAKSKGVFVNPALVEPFGLTLIEAAARGLPMVATKNGGPVDIQKMLDNGILVDPHDEAAIARALLSLVSERHRWLACRSSALANIHKYSWPQHCRTLLARVAECRLRRPAWHAGPLFDALSAADASHPALTDSINGLHDLSLRMSMDGLADPTAFPWLKGSFTGGGVDWGSLLRRVQHPQQSPGPPANGAEEEDDPTMLAANRAISSSATVFTAGRARFSGQQSELGPSAAAAAGGGGAGRAASMQIRLRRKLIAVAVDEYNVAGHPGSGAASALKAVVAHIHREQPQEPRSTGVAVATALSAKELLAYLRTEGIPLQHIDVAITSSGSTLYYSVPCPTSGAGEAAAAEGVARFWHMLEDGKGWQLVPDPDYFSHIEYRWSADAVRGSISRVLSSSHPLLTSSSHAAVTSPSSPRPLPSSSSHASPSSSGPTSSASFRTPVPPSASSSAAPSGACVPLASPSLAGMEALSMNAAEPVHPEELQNLQQALVEDELHSSQRCLAYRVLDPDKMPSLGLLRKRLRLRGLRLHLVYCRAASSLLVLPLHASRAQALRYLFVRWGLDVAKMTLIMAHSPAVDSDCSELLSGAHRTVLLQCLVPTPSLSKSRLALLDCQGHLAAVQNLPNAAVVEATGEWAQCALQEGSWK